MVQTRVLTTSRHLYVDGQESKEPDSFGLSTARAVARHPVLVLGNLGIAVAMR